MRILLAIIISVGFISNGLAQSEVTVDTNNKSQNQIGEQVSAPANEQNRESNLNVSEIEKGRSVSKLPPKLSSELYKLKPESSEANPASPGNYQDMVIGLFAVLGLIVLLAWAAKRFNVSGVTVNQSLKLQSVLPLGPKEKIAIVNVEGKRILLGVTPSNISLLCELEENQLKTSPQDGGEVFSFAQQIKKALKQGNTREDSQAS